MNKHERTTAKAKARSQRNTAAMGRENAQDRRRARRKAARGEAAPRYAAWTQKDRVAVLRRAAETRGLPVTLKTRKAELVKMLTVFDEVQR